MSGLYADSGTVYAATEGGLSIGAVPVPEPSTWVMGLAGIACAGWRVFRRRKLTASVDLTGRR